MKPSEDQHELIERMGRFWEDALGSRIAGRIIGWLMVCEPDHQSAAELVAALDVSAGSVSTQIRFLDSSGVVERITFPGDRVSYYRLREHVWVVSMRERFHAIHEMRRLGEAARDLVPETRPDRVTELEFVAGFLEEEWPALMARMEERLRARA